MKRIVLVLVGMVLVVGGVLGQGAASSDRNRLLGDWELVSISFGGKQIDIPGDKDFKLTFKADKVTMFDGAQKKEESPYKLDETKNPKQIEVEKMGNGQPGFKGIYKLEGDQLKIAVGLQGMGVPPQSFEGDQVVVMTLKRAARKNK